MIASIERHGYVPYLLLEERFDVASFKQRFPASRYSQLDWPPRARWPVDVVGYVR